MSSIVVRLFGRAVQVLACLLAAAAARSDRLARALAGRSDPVDRHHAEAKDVLWPSAGTHSAPARSRPHLAVERRTVGTVQDVPTLSHLEVVPEAELPSVLRSLIASLWRSGTMPWVEVDAGAAMVATDLLARDLRLVRRLP